jgi:hypothetical protein
MIRPGKTHWAGRWLMSHMPKTYNAIVDPDMKSDLNIRFMELNGAKQVKMELLQAMCKRKYRDNVSNKLTLVNLFNGRF